MADEAREVTVTLARRQGYEFAVRLDSPDAELVMDEPPPLGGGAGPNAVRFLAAAIGNCLAASLLLCLEKSRIEVGALRSTVRVTMVRNPAGRLRIGRVQVRLDPELRTMAPERLQRCLSIFEDYCIVTQSVREGVAVEVEVAAGEAGADA